MQLAARSGLSGQEAGAAHGERVPVAAKSFRATQVRLCDYCDVGGQRGSAEVWRRLMNGRPKIMKGCQPTAVKEPCRRSVGRHGQAGQHTAVPLPSSSTGRGAGGVARWLQVRIGRAAVSRWTDQRPLCPR